MLGKIQNIFHLIITGILLVLVMVFSIQKCNRAKKITTLENELYECVNTPPDTVTKTVTKTVTETKYIYPEPKYIYVKGDTIWDMDTIYDHPDYAQAWYNETYQKIDKKDTIEIDWEAHTYGYIEWIRFPSIRYPYRETIITKTVKEYVPTYYAKNHIALYFGTRIYDFVHMPPLDAGLMITFKDKFGFQVGGGRDFINKKWFFDGKGIFYIK